MSKLQQQRSRHYLKIVLAKLRPVAVGNYANLGDAAFDGVRSRPIGANNSEGKLAVCCRPTAAKRGWQVKVCLHQRPRSPKGAARKVCLASPAASPGARRLAT